jgi:UPF0716 protein FxsA
MRRRVPWWVLALLFIGVPLVEIYLIVQLGQAVGPWWTILVLIATGVLGSWLMKREGSRAWSALREALEAHRMPAKELADGALILIGGTLLVTPGFLSDVVGLLCVLPFTRPVARALLTRVVTRKLAARAAMTPPPGPGAAGFGFGGPGFGPGPAPGTARRPGHEDVIRGEVVDDDR